MTKFISAGGVIYYGFSDETLPVAAGLAEGTLFIFLDKPQVWIVRNREWQINMPLELSMEIPYGGIPDSVLISGPEGSVQRPVVALASAIAGQALSGVEVVLNRLLETNLAILTELRVNNILLQGVGTVPVTDDLDEIRAYVTTEEESITR